MTNAGTKTVTVTGTGNYAGVTGTANYVINKIDATTNVKIEGKAEYGEELTASVTTNSDGTPKTYTWYKNSVSEANKISGPSSSNKYTVGKGLAGDKIIVVVSIPAGTNYNASTKQDATDATNNTSETVTKKE